MHLEKEYPEAPQNWLNLQMINVVFQLTWHSATNISDIPFIMGKIVGRYRESSEIPDVKKLVVHLAFRHVTTSSSAGRNVRYRNHEFFLCIIPDRTTISGEPSSIIVRFFKSSRRRLIDVVLVRLDSGIFLTYERSM